eukprot:15436617-Alexandrium_andersonii.AAC.1
MVQSLLVSIVPVALHSRATVRAPDPPPTCRDAPRQQLWQRDWRSDAPDGPRWPPTRCALLVRVTGWRCGTVARQAGGQLS